MSFWSSKTYKAKKKHHCEYCGKPIQVGETYSRETGIYEGDFDDYCLCMRCREVLRYFKDSYSDELGSFFDDLINSDFLQCPKCGSINLREYDFSDDMQSAKCECDKCDNQYIVDLSSKAIKAHFERVRSWT